MKQSLYEHLCPDAIAGRMTPPTLYLTRPLCFAAHTPVKLPQLLRYLIMTIPFIIEYQHLDTTEG